MNHKPSYNTPVFDSHLITTLQGPLEVVAHVYNEVIASENLIGILLTTTPQLIPGSFSDNVTQTKFVNKDGPTLSLGYRLLCGM